MKEYAEYDGLGLAELVAKGEVTAGELLNEAVTRAEKAQPELNCFANMFPELAEAQIADGERKGAFQGVPFATKDLAVQVKGAPLTSGSRAFKNNVSAADGVMASRYKAAGMSIFATTTTPEFGLTTTTESILFGQTRNPWDVTRTSGGSSGGASAAVAAGVIPVAQASDGGGSIRIPASCTGLFGMKPSRGRTPMGPATTEGWNGQSVTHAVSRTVRDNAALLDATAGRETGSRYDAPAPDGTFLSALDADPKPLRLAIWGIAPNGTKPDADAQAGIDATRKLLEALGHVVEEASPVMDGAALGKGLLMTISAAMAMIFEDREAAVGHALGADHMEPVTMRMREFGKTVPMAELMRANQAAITAAMMYEQFLDDGNYDFVLCPVTSRKPDLLGTLSLNPTNFDAYGEAVTTFAPWCGVFNQMGAPAMSVPLHWTDDGLPIGMMFGARCGEERALFALAGQLERAQPWAHRKPPVWVG